MIIRVAAKITPPADHAAALDLCDVLSRMVVMSTNPFLV